MTHLTGRLLGLRLWFLWLRQSYRFRWAHGPLCSHFRGGVFRIGRVHLCRSCVCAYCGFFLCAAGCLFFDAVRESTAILLLCLMAPTIGFSTPQLYRRYPRLVRDLLRFSMGCCIALCICAMLRGNILVSATCASIFLLFWKRYFGIRRKRKAEACNRCPELEQKGICSGCRLQADAVRAYETEATNLLLASGICPVSNKWSADQ